MSEYVARELKLPNHIQVRVRIYANKEGLASTYYNSKILHDANGLDVFIRGLNMRLAMCDFVDAGAGKECADVKLKGMLDFQESF